MRCADSLVLVTLTRMRSGWTKMRAFSRSIRVAREIPFRFQASTQPHPPGPFAAGACQ